MVLPKAWTQPETSPTVKSAPSSALTLAADSRRASGVASHGLTVLSDLGSAPDFGNQLISAKAAERSRAGRSRMMIGVAAAAVLIAAGAGTYFWHAKARSASAHSASKASSGAVAAPSAALGAAPGNPETANSTSPASNPQPPASNPQPAASNATAALNSNGRQPNPSAPGNSPRGNPNQNNVDSQGTANRAANNRLNNLAPITVNARQPNDLPMNIAPPTSPSRSNASNTITAPDLGNVASQAAGNAPTMTSIISSAMPAPPAPVASGGMDPSSTASSVQAPKLISSVLPVYPRAAAVRGDSGEVTVDATVNELGKVVAVKAISGPPTLREAAITAVSQWRYQPAMLNGKTITTHVILKLMFNLPK